MLLHLPAFCFPEHLVYGWRDLTRTTSCSLAEFTGLMKGQIAARSMDDEIRDTFAVFGSDIIDVDLLRLMVKVPAARAICSSC